MAKELLFFADRIKLLRESAGLTQAELAKRLGLSRSSVNSWEMGLTIPSTQYIVELAKKFDVSSDYLLGIEETSNIPTKGLTQKQISALLAVIQCFRNENDNAE